jgi:DNA-binding CsgD family transcriptional regulator
LTRYRVGRSIGDPADAMFLSTHALDEVRAFHTSGLYLTSADYRWVRDNVGACSWGWAHDERAAGRLSAEECAVMDRLGRRRAGYTVSFPVGAPRSKAAMGLAMAAEIDQAEVDAHWAAHEDALMMLTHMAHLKLSVLPMPVARPALGPRQREVLEWIADGKTLQDVAVLTGLSLSSVEKHLRRAREHLEVETTAQAVAKVGFLNQLFVTELPGLEEGRPGG